MIKLALPAGDLRLQTAALLSAIGLHSEEYAAGSRSLRFPLAAEEAELRVFREKDIPIQIALGNYDLGICNRIWLQELLAHYPQEEVVALRPLGYGRLEVIAAAATETVKELGPIEGWSSVEGLRIVSEFPNLGETFALAWRLPRYHLIPLWGAAAAYPPEDADLAVFAGPNAFPTPATAEGMDNAVVWSRLQPLVRLTSGSAWLLANRRSLYNRDLSPLLGPLLRAPVAGLEPALPTPLRGAPQWGPRRPWLRQARTDLRLALPDGHAQRHTFAALMDAGFSFDGYGEREAERRPASGISGLRLKVIRPQDMPQQVALGNFDLAITGRDWLLDHRTAFPSSPVREVADLCRSRYSLSVVVDQHVPGDDLSSALHYWRAIGRPIIRIASEYANLGDHFARQRHIGRYQIIPVAGASEGFVPEDCEILLEGTETGTSVAANRLKVIDRMFESTNCLIAGSVPPPGAAGQLFDQIVERLRRSVAAPM
ncbi:MAG: ATP phosphoribosyltransferase [Dehalococcoidia bacterium]